MGGGRAGETAESMYDVRAIDVEMPVKWGLLSTAAIADLVLEGCAGSPAIDFVAVGSRDAIRAQQWAEPRGIPKAYGSYEALLSDPEVEAVYVALPNSMHIDWSVRALEHGKHVLCEKPLSREPLEVRRAFSAAHNAERLLREAFMYRFHPQTETVKKLVADGVVGDLRHVRATLSYPMQDEEADVRSFPDLAGGALMDVGCYCVSGFRLFAGEPDTVFGHSVQGSHGVDVRFVGTLWTELGITGQFDCGMVLPRRDALELVGDRGSIFVPDPWHCRGAPIVVRGKERTEEVPVGGRDAYREEFEAFSLAIRGDGLLKFGATDAIAQAAALAALHMSAEEKAPIELRSMVVID